MYVGGATAALWDVTAGEEAPLLVVYALVACAGDANRAMVGEKMGHQTGILENTSRTRHSQVVVDSKDKLLVTSYFDPI
jgi:hypothetical protein